MKVFQSGMFKIAIVAALSLAVTGCTPKKYRPEEKVIKRVNRVSHRQLHPQQTYNRLRWVHLPEVVPVKNVESSLPAERPMILPIITLEVENTPLKEVVLILGATTRYSTYCSSKVEAKVVTLKEVGTIEELARAIEKSAKVKVMVDHKLQSIRVLGDSYRAPKFFQKG